MLEERYALVLVENEETEGNRYDHWEDATGERYHFPNQYRNKVRPGTPFVYYRGTRRAGGARGQAEYFGWGTIGEVFPDPNNAQAERKALHRFFAQIADYTPFPSPVQIRFNGEYLESIQQNQWSVAVRWLSRSQFERIVGLSGLASVLGATPAPPEMPALGAVKAEQTQGLLVPPSLSGSQAAAGSQYRRSRFSTAIGRRAEEVALAELERLIGAIGGTSLRWVAAAGETPGWDIEFYRGSELVAVEVKGTTGLRFPSIELTANEWAAAQELRGRYWLCLVASCTSQAPRIEFIPDPASRVDDGSYSVEPAVLRFRRS